VKALNCRRAGPPEGRQVMLVHGYPESSWMWQDAQQVLAAAGLYDEAAAELSHTFTLDHGELSAQLAGRVSAHASTFTELLAPERRASLFQFVAADTDENARLLKALLAFDIAMKASGVSTSADEKEMLAAAQDFASGADEMRAFRQLYVAARLLRRGVGWQTIMELTEGAKGGIEAALNVPYASVAAFADELRDVRSRAISAGATTTAPDVSRDLLSKILRGRIEDLAGWALYNKGDAAEGAVRLRRAVSVTPENTPWARAALWHLGAALDASGNQKDALAAYVKAYRLAPDSSRRFVVEALYRKMNNSLDGLDKLLGETLASASTSEVRQPPSSPTPADESASSASGASSKNPETGNGATPPPQPVPSATPAQDAAATAATATPELSPTPEASSPTAVPTPSAIPLPSSSPTSTPEPPAATDATPPAASPTPEQTRERQSAPARSTRSDGACEASIGESSVEINKSGGSATFTVSLEHYAAAAQPPRVNAATPNWADIVVLAEPHTASDGNSYKFTVNSTSQRAGVYVVNITTPCGKREVTVNVK